MDELLARYLFKYKQCPLPSLGCLVIVWHSAMPVAGEKKIFAPKPFIEFNTAHADETALVEYITAEENSSETQAAKDLQDYCDILRTMPAHTQKSFTGAGIFSVTEDGKFIFEPAPLPEIFNPAATAEKVIRQNNTHKILVGDTETTNTVMFEYYTEQPVQKERWWLWAAAITLVAAVFILFYFNDHLHNNAFGNAQPVHAAAQTDTYTTGN